MTDTTTPRRGRPRDGAVDRRVLSAAWELLETGGYAGLNMDEVAERAAVAKTTLYRRWPTKDHLAVAVAARLLGEVPVPDTGDLRRDLTTFVSAVATNLNNLRTATGSRDGAPEDLLAELVAAGARHPDLGDMARAAFARRHALVLARLQRATEREGLRAGADHAILIDQLAGPVYYRFLVTRAPVDQGYAARLVAAVLDGALAPG
jgi:AcrR family transcriptional regulator